MNRARPAGSGTGAVLQPGSRDQRTEPCTPAPVRGLMRAARGVLRVDLSPYVDRDGWQTVDACWHVWPDGGASPHDRLVTVDLGNARRLDDRVVDALVDRLAGASVEVRGTYANAVDLLVAALNHAAACGVA